MKRLVLLALAAATLSGCGRPGAQEPAATGAAPGKPAHAADVQGPAPAPPAWAQPFLGKVLTKELPTRETCVGNTDAVVHRYAGPPAGGEIGGWGWDTAAKQRIERVLLTDESQRTIGAGQGGAERLDVPRAKPEIQDPNTGWRGQAAARSGLVLAYGLVDGGRAICPLGEIEL